MNARRPNPFAQVIGELHRRSIWQVLGIYLLGSWVVLQVVDVLEGVVTLPEWFGGLAFGLLLVGLPVVVATAFVQQGGPGQSEGAPSGVIPGSEPTDDASVAIRLFTWRRAILGGVGAFAVLGFVGTAWVLFGGAMRADGEPIATESIEPSIAVLRFDDLSQDRNQQYFVEGLSEEVINALAQIQGLKVSARTSTFTFQDLGLDVGSIADSLGVATVLEGSVRREGDQIRITAQLIEAGTGFHLWSDTFDRELTAIFQIQDEIARNIAERLQVTLSGPQAERLVAAGTANTAAHEAYLLGRSIWNRRTWESLRAATAEFERAIALDPAYADAYAGLADSYSLMDAYQDPVQPADYPAIRQQALVAARRAVELAPESGVARTSLAGALSNAGAWTEALREFDRALALTPSYGTGRAWMAATQIIVGDFEAARINALEARALDPQLPYYSAIVGFSEMALGRYDEAVVAFREAVDLDPSWPRGWGFLAMGLLSAGNDIEGMVAYTRMMELERPMSVDQAEVEAFRRAHVLWRDTGEEQAFDLDRIPQSSTGLTRLWLATSTGQKERSISELEALVASGAIEMAGLVVRAYYSGELFEDDPRFLAILDELGVER